MNKLPLAVLIDGENVSASHMPTIMEYAKRLGEPLARCVVGDFAANRLSEWADIAPENALETCFQRSGGKNKNSADIALTIRAMDLLAERRFGSFLIVSSDRDFAPLALRLRRSGIAVYGMGEKEKSGIAWRAACTEFFELARKEAPAKAINRAAPKPAAEKKLAPVEKKPFTDEDREAVRTILQEIAIEDNPWIALSQLGLLIPQKSADLGTRFCGKNKLLKNLRAAGLVEEEGLGSAAKVRLRSSEMLNPSPTLPHPRSSPQGSHSLM